MQPHLCRNCHYQKNANYHEAPTINEIIKSNVLPSEFHIQGLISNESKQKWRE